MPHNQIQKVPPLARLLLKQMTVYNERHSIIDDFEENFHEISQSEGIWKAKCWYWMSVLKSFPEYLRLICVWRVIMFRNYLIIAYRYFTGNKLFS